VGSRAGVRQGGSGLPGWESASRRTGCTFARSPQQLQAELVEDEQLFARPLRPGDPHSERGHRLAIASERVLRGCLGGGVLVMGLFLRVVAARSFVVQGFGPSSASSTRVRGLTLPPARSFRQACLRKILSGSLMKCYRGFMVTPPELAPPTRPLP